MSPVIHGPAEEYKTRARARRATLAALNRRDLAISRWRLIVFAVLTAASFTIVRPIARRHINMPPQLRTGTAALIGRTAIVTERIVNDEAAGQVRIDGEVWSARAYDEDKVLEPGTRVHVMEIRGATALVDD